MMKGKSCIYLDEKHPAEGRVSPKAPKGPWGTARWPLWPEWGVGNDFKQAEGRGLWGPPVSYLGTSTFARREVGSPGGFSAEHSLIYILKAPPPPPHRRLLGC